MAYLVKKFWNWLKSRFAVNALYRYTPHTSEHRDEVILNSQLWFTKPENFNDPLDSRLDYRQEYSQAEIEDFWRGFCKANPIIPKNLMKYCNAGAVMKSLLNSKTRYSINLEVRWECVVFQHRRATS